MGSDVQTAELEAIATAGNGQYFYGSNTASLSTLFSQVQKELVTQQTFGVETPLPNGEYTLELVSERLSDGATTSHSSSITVGDSLPRCLQ